MCLIRQWLMKIAVVVLPDPPLRPHTPIIFIMSPCCYNGSLVCQHDMKQVKIRLALRYYKEYANASFYPVNIADHLILWG